MRLGVKSAIRRLWLAAASIGRHILKLLRFAARALVNQATAGVLIVVLAVYGAFWVTETKAPQSELHGVSFDLPEVNLAAADSYVINLTVMIPDDAVGGSWIIWRSCRNPVDVNGFVELRPELWEGKTAGLRSATSHLRVALLGSGYSDFAFYGAAEFPEPRLRLVGEYQSRLLPYTRSGLDPGRRG